MNEPEEFRKIEKEAEKASAEMAATMLRHPGTRWILSPVQRLMKWCATQAAKALREDGWR